mmetsp:Transcript_40416/g.111391  ORF Transcript_40416/g.111391 Transcript_40416/m.111391 type:complete len:295 (+) Transcript_40416:177-1061(+)
MDGNSSRPSPSSSHSSQVAKTIWKTSSLGRPAKSPLDALAQRGHSSQMPAKRLRMWSSGPSITVVPESGIAPQAGSSLLSPQKRTSLLAEPTDMPRKSSAQCNVPTEGTPPSSFLVPRRSTPGDSPSLKQMEKRSTFALRRKPGTMTLALWSWSIGTCNASSSCGRSQLACTLSLAPATSSDEYSDCNWPRPRMPSKEPTMSRWRPTMRSRPSSMSAFMDPTCTTSVVTAALMEPLPNSKFSTETSRSSGTMKVAEVFDPTKHRSDSGHSPASLHMHEGMITASEPVSATTSNC